MGSCFSSPKPIDVEYLNGEPTFDGDEVVKCFEKDNGLLFRIMNSKTKEWAYYNDTTEFNMHVRVTFDKDANITALDNADLEHLDSGEIVVKVVVRPLVTERLIQGRVFHFRSKVEAVPLENEAVEGAEGEAAAEAPAE